MNVHDVPLRQAFTAPSTASLVALSGIPLVKHGDDISTLIVTALGASHESLRDGDVIVIAQKIVSKAQGRIIPLASIKPSLEAEALAQEVNKDPRLVELILRESSEVVSYRRDVLIVAHRLGFVIANAGIDQSNVDHATGVAALLLPERPDETCAELRLALKHLTGAEVGVIINDSHGRAFRNGTVGVAIGASGLPGLADLRGHQDLYGRPLQNTEVALADEIASAASLLMGQANESRPIVIVRGIPKARRDGMAAELIRPKTLDLFRRPTADAVLRGRRSVRHYIDQPIPETMVRQLLGAATSAPSAHNRQPWRFAVLESVDIRNKLACAMGEKLRADRIRDGDNPVAIDADVSRSIARISGAPMAIVVCMTMIDMDRYVDARRNEAERQMAVQGTAMAMQNLLLAANAAGLGSSVMCAPLFCPETVRVTLNFPSDWEPQALVTLGYPASQGKPYRRRALSEVVRFLGRRS